jgi:hypothetical protein
MDLPSKLVEAAVDQIASLPGIGRKTAQTLLKHFHTLDGVLGSIDEIGKLKFRNLSGGDTRFAGLTATVHVGLPPEPKQREKLASMAGAGRAPAAALGGAAGRWSSPEPSLSDRLPAAAAAPAGDGLVLAGHGRRLAGLWQAGEPAAVSEALRRSTAGRRRRCGMRRAGRGSRPSLRVCGSRLKIVFGISAPGAPS